MIFCTKQRWLRKFRPGRSNQSNQSFTPEGVKRYVAAGQRAVAIRRLEKMVCRWHMLTATSSRHRSSRDDKRTNQFYPVFQWKTCNLMLQSSWHVGWVARSGLQRLRVHEVIRIRSLPRLCSPWRSGSTTLDLARHDGLPKGEEHMAATDFETWERKGEETSTCGHVCCDDECLTGKQIAQTCMVGFFADFVFLFLSRAPTRNPELPDTLRALNSLIVVGVFQTHEVWVDTEKPLKIGSIHGETIERKSKRPKSSYWCHIYVFLRWFLKKSRTCETIASRIEQNRWKLDLIKIAKSTSQFITNHKNIHSTWWKTSKIVPMESAHLVASGLSDWDFRWFSYFCVKTFVVIPGPKIIYRTCQKLERGK